MLQMHNKTIWPADWLLIKLKLLYSDVMGFLELGIFIWLPISRKAGSIWMPDIFIDQVLVDVDYRAKLNPKHIVQWIQPFAIKLPSTKKRIHLFVIAIYNIVEVEIEIDSISLEHLCYHDCHAHITRNDNTKGKRTTSAQLLHKASLPQSLQW